MRRYRGAAFFVVGLVLLAAWVGAIALQAQASDPETWPIVYQEDFQDPASGWHVTRAYVNGTYEIQVNDDWSIAWSRIPGDREFLNFAVEVEVQSVERTGEFGFLFRYVDSSNFYCFTIRTDGRYRLRKQKNDAWQTLVDWTSCEGFKPGVLNHLQVIAQGEMFSFLFNGELLTEVTDNTFRGGQIALCAGTFEEAGFTVRFDNFLVRSDPAIQAMADQAAALFRQAQESRAWDLQAAANGFQEVLVLYQRLGWKEKKADALLDLGDCLYLLSDYQAASARYERSLAIFREIEDRGGEAQSLGNLGLCYEALGDYRKAIDYHEQALTLFQAIGDLFWEEMEVLNQLGVCYFELAEYGQAIDYHKQALTILADWWEEVADPNDLRQGIVWLCCQVGEAALAPCDFMAVSLNHLGLCYEFLGDYRTAIDYYEQSLAIKQEIRDRRGEAESLNNLGDCYDALGDYRTAIDYHEQSLAIFREIEDRGGEAESLNSLGFCYEFLGDYRTAIDYHEQSLAILREIGDRWGEAMSLASIGTCYGPLGDYSTAIDYHEQSLAILREIGDRGGEAASLNSLSIWYKSLGDYSTAIDCHEQSLAIFREIENRRGEANSLNNLGDCYESLGDYSTAIDSHEQSLAIFRKIGDQQGEAESLRKLGDCYESLGDYSTAIDSHEQSLAIFREIGDRWGEAMSLNNLGLCYFFLRDYRKAIDYYEQSLAIFREIGDQQGEAASLASLGICYESLWDYRKAIDYYEQSLPIFREIEDRQGEAESLDSLGYCYRVLGDYRKAIDYYEQSLPIFREIGDQQGEAASLGKLGICYQSLGDYRKAIDYYEQSLPIFREIGDQQGEAESLGNLSICYESLGDYRKAIDYYEQCLPIFREIGDQQGEAASLRKLGDCYESLGDYSTAIDSHEQSLAISRKIGDRWGEAMSLNSLGICYDALGDDGKAIDYHEQSLAIFQEIGDRGGEAASLANLGGCYNFLGDHRKAIDYHEQSLAIFREIGHRGGEAYSLMGLGDCYESLGDYSTAIDYYERSLQVVQAMVAEEGYATAAPETLSWLHIGLGFSRQALGELQQAAEAWKQAVAAIEAMRGRLARAGFKLLFMRKKFFVYKWLVQTLLEVGEPEEALFYAERAKARTLVDMMETAMVLRAEVLPAGLQPAGEQVRALSALAGATAEDQLLRGAPTRSGIDRAVQRTQEEYEAFLAQLEQDHPALGETLSVNSERLWQHFQYVQGELGEGTVALHYFVTNEETIVWAITEGGIQTASRIPVARADLAERVRVLREVIESPPALGQEMVSYLDALARANDLYELLILPVEDYIQDAKHLVIVPSDVLFYLPFGALYICPGCEGRDLYGGKFLLERYPISYAPSLSSLYWPFQNRGDGIYESVLSVGNPTGDLVHAEEEAQAVASLFPYGDLLLREEGTKERVLALLRTIRYDAVHFSTHGLFDRVLPLLSGVLFHGEEMVYAGEILGLSLPVELVVLSACQTALPPELEEGLVVGDEIHGLGQALFTAGVPSALLTLWNVADRSTRYLMETMYRALMDGADKAEALRRAQVAFLDDDDLVYRHPYYWAPFVLYGDWR